MARERTREERQIFMLPLRAYELPDTPAEVLAIPAEMDTFWVPDERPTPDELRSLARPVTMPPLRPDEMPDTVVRGADRIPDPLLDDPEWGAAKRAPQVTLQKGRLLRPWDD
jgi:hypothetical protein